MNPADRLPPRRRNALDRRRHAIRPLVESLEQRLQLSLSAVAAAPAQIESGTSPNYYDQHEPSVAMDAAGDYVVAWLDNLNSNGYTAEIEAQVFSASGTAKTGVIAVSPIPTPTNYTAYTPAVAMDPNGDFVVTWGLTPPQTSATGAYYYDILARRFNLSGVAQGNAIQVTPQATEPYELDQPTVAMDNTSFVIGWSEFANAPYTSTIYAQRYNFSGSTNTLAGATITVATSNTSSKTTVSTPLVAMDSGGDFVVVYDYDTNSTTSVLVQAYNASGAAQGSPFSVNSSTETNNPSVAMNGAGQFVIAYEIFNTSQTYGYADVYANQYALTGTESSLSVTTLKSGVEVDPQPYPYDQVDPTAAIDGQGIATIAWEDYYETNTEGASGDDTIDAIRLNPDGSLVSTTPLTVATPTTSYNLYNVHAASGAGGDVDFVWELDPYGNPSPGSGEVIDDRPYYYVNDAPTIATPANQKITENGSTTVSLSGISAGGNEEQTLTVTASSSNTSLIVPTVTYTSPNSTGTLNLNPTAGQSGTATITVTVTDSGGTANGGVNSVSTQFTLTVVGKPTANAQSVTTAINTAKAITLTGSDPDNPPLSLTYTVTGNPTHGMLTGTAPNLTYTPTAGYSGTDSFTFTDSNGTVTSSPATVSITVTPGTPTANAQTVSVAHDSSGTPITLTGTDPDTPPLALTYAFTQPAHGTVTVSGSAGSPTVIYTPLARYHGTDSFTFTTNNGTNTSSPATVTLNVAVGTPTANAQTVSVAHDSSGTPITLSGTDDDVPALTQTYAVFSQPAHGMLTGTAPNLTYIPTAGYHGSDSFTFKVSNGTNTSTAATVTLNVAVGTPIANAQTVSVAHDSSGTAITLTSTDDDTPALTETYAFTQPAHGTVVVSGGAGSPTVIYTPTAGYHGSDSFTFTDSNGTNSSAPATVTLNVAVGTPTANSQTVSTPQGTAVAVGLTGSDDDSPALPLTYAIVAGQGPANGTISNFNSSTGTLTYTPNAGYSGSDRFEFTISNGINTSAPAVVTVNVTASAVATVSGTVGVTWGTAGSATLQTNADGLRLLPAGRNTDIPWLGINTLSITLSQPETLLPSEILVNGITVAAYAVTLSGSGTSYTIRLPQGINAADRVTVTIASPNIATFTRRLDVLPGDVNDDGVVTSADVSQALSDSGQIFLFADIDGDGTVTTADIKKIRSLNGTSLPPLP